MNNSYRTLKNCIEKIKKWAAEQPEPESQSGRCLQIRHSLFTRKKPLRTIQIVLRNICLVHDFSSPIQNRHARKSFTFAFQKSKNVSVCQNRYCHAISILSKLKKSAPTQQSPAKKKRVYFFSGTAPQRKGEPLKPYTHFWKKLHKIPRRESRPKIILQ